MILAIDIGTSFLKASVVDKKGKTSFSSRKQLTILGTGKIKEVDPDLWVCCFNSLFHEIPEDIKRNLKAIVISGNGPTIIPVDKQGNSLGNAMLWMDTRAEDTVQELRSKLNEFVPGNFFLSKVYWYKKNKNELFNNTEYFLSCPEYLCYKLTGNAYTLLPGEGFLPFYWNDSKLEKLGIPSKKMPEYIGLTNIWGNYKGIPVICAGPDFLMSVLGSGAVEPGIVCDRTGTSEGLNFCSSSYIEIDGLRTLPHVVPGLYTLAGLIPDSGKLLTEGKEEAIIKKYSDLIDKMIVNGLNIKDVRVIGGHSSLSNLNKAKADVIEKPLRVYPLGAELVGNAVLGYYVLGEYSSIKEACERMVREVVCYNVS